MATKCDLNLREIVLELSEGAVLDDREIEETSPLKEVGFDSFKIVQLIMEIEQKAQISIIDQDIDMQDFYSIESIKNLLIRIGGRVDD